MIWDGCYKCESETPLSKCLKCNTGYMLDKKAGACVECGADMCCPVGSTSKTIDACTECSADGTECTKCSKPWKLDNKVCKLSGATSLTLGFAAILAAIIAALI